VKTCFSQQARPLSGKARIATLRATRWALAREIRAQLRPVMPREDVAKYFGVTPNYIEQIELEALSKVIVRLKEACRGA
jgi:hypothetical protein